MIEITSSCIGVESLTQPEFLDFLSYWEGLRGDRIAPSWSEIELIEMPARVLPYLTVVDVCPVPLDFIYSFYGTGHMSLKARDLTGHSIRDARPSENGPIVFDQYRRVVEARKPMAFVRKFTDTGSDQDLTQVTLRLPLSSDNENIQWIMSLSDLRNSPDMRDFYETYGRDRPFRATTVRRAGAV